MSQSRSSSNQSIKQKSKEESKSGSQQSVDDSDLKRKSKEESKSGSQQSVDDSAFNLQRNVSKKTDYINSFGPKEEIKFTINDDKDDEEWKAIELQKDLEKIHQIPNTESTPFVQFPSRSDLNTSTDTEMDSQSESSLWSSSKSSSNEGYVKSQKKMSIKKLQSAKEPQKHTIKLQEPEETNITQIKSKESHTNSSHQSKPKIKNAFKIIANIVYNLSLIVMALTVLLMFISIINLICELFFKIRVYLRPEYNWLLFVHSLVTAYCQLKLRWDVHYCSNKDGIKQSDLSYDMKLSVFLTITEFMFITRILLVLFPIKG